MKHVRSVMSLVLLWLFSFAAAQDDAIKVEIESYRRDASGQFVASTTASPGERVKYIVRAMSTEPTTLPAGTVSVVGPVPPDSTYVFGSAVSEEDVSVDYSEDGETFTDKLPDDIVAVRWTLERPLEPYETITLEYQVDINGPLAGETTSSSVSDPLPSSSDDFRGFNWGATAEEVRDSESFSFLTEEENALVFSGQVSGLDVVAVYQFLEDDRLYSAGYLFQEEYTNPNNHIDDFEDITATLTRVYGQPTFNEAVWSNDLYKDDRSEYGFAASLGHVTYTATWETETTLIHHVLSGNNYEVNHGVTYTSKELNPEIERQEQETEDDAF